MNHNPSVQIAIRALTLRSRVTNVLDKLGLKHITTLSSEDIFQRLDENRPALLIIDLSLPGVDTIDVISRICSREAGVGRPAVVAITNRMLKGQLTLAEQAGADEVMSHREFTTRMEETITRYSAT